MRSTMLSSSMAGVQALIAWLTRSQMAHLDTAWAACWHDTYVTAEIPSSLASARASCPFLPLLLSAEVTLWVLPHWLWSSRIIFFFLKTVLPGQLDVKSRLAPHGDGCEFLFLGLWGDCEQPGLSGSLSIWPYWLCLCVLLALKCFWQNSLKSDATSERGLWRISSRHLFNCIKKVFESVKKKKEEEEIWAILPHCSPDSRSTHSVAVPEDYNDDVTSWKLNMKASVNTCTIFTH